MSNAKVRTQGERVYGGETFVQVHAGDFAALIAENARLSAKVDELQTDGTRLALERQKAVAERDAAVAKVTDAEKAENEVAARLFPGWLCPLPTCGVFNGESVRILERCRACGVERPNPYP